MTELTLEGNILVTPISGLHESIASLFQDLPKDGRIISMTKIVKEGKRNDGLLHHLSSDALAEIRISQAVVPGRFIHQYGWEYSGRVHLRSTATQGYHEMIYDYYAVCEKDNLPQNLTGWGTLTITPVEN